MPTSKPKSFFVGPAKIPQPKTLSTPPVKNPPQPQPFRPRCVSNPVADAQSNFLKTVATHREQFRQFLRSSLALLDNDIVEIVVKEFDNHCTCENRVVESSSHYLATATRNRILPELRHFQFILDASETNCTPECVQAITVQREVAISQSRTNDLSAIGMPPEKGGIRPGSQVDLTLLGGVNDLLAWGEDFRDTLVTAYRNGESTGIDQPNLDESLEGTGKRSISNRPSTAPLRRRQPPVGGGFIRGLHSGSSEADQRNIYTTTSTTTGMLSTSTLSTTSRQRPSSAKNIRKRRSNPPNHEKPETRRLLRQTLGSYYSHDRPGAATNSTNLGSLLTSSSSGYNTGVRHPMPIVRRTRQISNPNNALRRRAKHRAKNNIDLANYNAFHARPMLRGGSNFEGPRRRQIPRSSSTSTIDMQKRNLLRGLDLNLDNGEMEMDMEIQSYGKDRSNHTNDGKISTRKQQRKHRNNNNPSSFAISKGLQAAKSRHGKQKKKHQKKSLHSPPAMSGWEAGGGV